MVDNFSPVIPQERLLECIHCGLCTSSCPTYLETRNENDSPRGRIHLMRGVIEQRIELTPLVTRHLDLCLDCRGCETACPSGVKYSQIIEPFRHEMERTQLARKRTWWQQGILRYLFPNRNLLWWSVQPAIFLRKFGLLKLGENAGLVDYLPPMLKQMLNMLPRNRRYIPALPNFLPAQGKKRAKVALFLGCAGDALYRDLNWLTAKVLQVNGCEVVIPRHQTCCGAIAAHSGMLPQALSQAEKNIRCFEELDEIDAIITNISGCGAQLKEYHHLYHYADGCRHLTNIHPRAQLKTPVNPLLDETEGLGEVIRHPQPIIDPRSKFGNKVKDITEFLVELGPREMTKTVNKNIAYHPACHLQHAQKITAAPLNLLKLIPGLTTIPFHEAEICCGAAGSYNLTEIDMAHQLGTRKLDNLCKTEIEGVVTGNIGCMMQMEYHARKQQKNLWVKHTIELLAAGYGLIEL